MTLDGEVVAYIDPLPRSKWAEPEPEVIDLDQDDLNAVAEAGAEVAATDLDAELAELVPDADGHLFSQFVNRASMKMVTDLSPSERLVFVGHALAMGPADSHHWPIESVGATVGVTRAAATRATAKLVELGVLHKKDRGRIDAVKSRPAEYRLTERIKLTTTRVSNEHTGDSDQTECPTCVSNEHTGAGVSNEHTIERLKDLSLLASSSEVEKIQKPSAFVAAGSVCDTCGGQVTTHPTSGAPNPQCKKCYTDAKDQKATKQALDVDHLQTMKALIGAGWGNQHNRGNAVSAEDLLSKFGGDQAAVDAAHGLRWKFGKMNDREASTEWRNAYRPSGVRS